MRFTPSQDVSGLVQRADRRAAAVCNLAWPSMWSSQKRIDFRLEFGRFRQKAVQSNVSS